MWHVGFLTLFYLALLVTIGGLLGGFLGALHPAADSFAVFRIPIAVIVVLILLALMIFDRERAVLHIVLAVLVLAAVAPTVFSYWKTGDEVADNSFAIYQKNLRFDLSDPTDIANDIVSSGADIVTLQEVSPRNLALLELLKDTYPVQHFCPFRSVGGTAVLTKLPTPDQTEKFCAEGVSSMRVIVAGNEVTVMSVHYLWPWPHDQSVQAKNLRSTVANLKKPIMIAGDFNMVPWGRSVRALAKAAGAAKAGPTATTLVGLGGLFRLPIDHVLLPNAWRGTQEIRPKLGSDHRGVLVRFEATPGDAN